VVATVAENVLGDLNAITSFNPDREKQCWFQVIPLMKLFPISHESVDSDGNLQEQYHD
jgi:hypothetical protein